MSRPPVVDDMQRLLAPFRLNVERVLTGMLTRGFEPRVFETWRSPKRADWLVAQNRFASGRRSMHCYGLAADIVDRTRLWDYPEFFRVLGVVANSHGLTWGGDAFGPGNFDGPHIQAVPLALQGDVRRCKTEREVHMLALGYLSAVP